ncbi:hypothetical protein [Streptomyces sp. MMS24-I29]|uniref:hypothetical protein n=1 Tax=Streptomyces sp. MMS24-I29 TaxID=3351480 RepID=UPI003C7B470A
MTKNGEGNSAAEPVEVIEQETLAMCEGCGEPLPPPKPGRGRPREFHSGKCRMRAHRRKHQPGPDALRAEALAILADLRLPALGDRELDQLDAETLSEVVRQAQAARAALARLAELVPFTSVPPSWPSWSHPPPSTSP